MHDKEKEQLMSSAGFLDGHVYLVISISRVSNIIWTSVHMPNPNLYTYTMIGKFLACQLLWFYHEFHDFSASLSLTATQANLTGSPFLLCEYLQVPL